jgi:hypothetical protein
MTKRRRAYVPRSYTLPERLDHYTQPHSGACDLWVGWRDRKGRAQLCWQGVAQYVPRLLWEIHNGAIPAGKVVSHTCGNGGEGCVSLQHLVLKDRGEVMSDNVAGSNNVRAKLTEADVREIRRLILQGVLVPKQIAKQFGVTDQAIRLIKNGKRWAHVK